jgi:hypothetical protein
MKKCSWRNKCRNGNEGCYAREPNNCVRFMPTKGTNLTKIDGIVETPPNVDDDKFGQYFINWIESMGWSFCGCINKYEEKEDE